MMGKDGMLDNAELMAELRALDERWKATHKVLWISGTFTGTSLTPPHKSFHARSADELDAMLTADLAES